MKKIIIYTIMFDATNDVSKCEISCTLSHLTTQEDFFVQRINHFVITRTYDVNSYIVTELIIVTLA